MFLNNILLDCEPQGVLSFIETFKSLTVRAQFDFHSPSAVYGFLRVLKKRGIGSSVGEVSASYKSICEHSVLLRKFSMDMRSSTQWAEL